MAEQGTIVLGRENELQNEQFPFFPEEEDLSKLPKKMRTRTDLTILPGDIILSCFKPGLLMEKARTLRFYGSRNSHSVHDDFVECTAEFELLGEDGATLRCVDTGYGTGFEVLPRRSVDQVIWFNMRKISSEWCPRTDVVRVQEGESVRHAMLSLAEKRKEVYYVLGIYWIHGRPDETTVKLFHTKHVGRSISLVECLTRDFSMMRHSQRAELHQLL